MNDTEKSKARVDILGQEYILKGNDPPDYLEYVGKLIADKTRQVNNNLPSYSQTRVAVLVALQVADELCKLKDDYEKIVEELRYLDKIHKNG